MILLSANLWFGQLDFFSCQKGHLGWLFIGCDISIYKSNSTDLTEAQAYQQAPLQVSASHKQHRGITVAGKALLLQNNDSWTSSPAQLSPIHLPFPPLWVHFINTVELHPRLLSYFTFWVRSSSPVKPMDTLLLLKLPNPSFKIVPSACPSIYHQSMRTVAG